MENKILEIRDFTQNDIVAQDRYLSESSDEYLYNMGVDPSTVWALPSSDRVQSILATPVQDRSAHTYSIVLNDETIGVFVVKKIQFGKIAELHLHIFEARNRQRGFTSLAFWKMLPKVFETFKIEVLLCQPCETNLGPNAFLQKLGLKVLATFTVPAEGILREHQANRYEITRAFYEIHSRKQSRTVL